MAQWFELACKSLQGLVWIERHTSSQAWRLRPHWSQHKCACLSFQYLFSSSYWSQHFSSNQGSLFDLQVQLKRFLIVFPLRNTDQISTQTRYKKHFFLPSKPAFWIFLKALQRPTSVFNFCLADQNSLKVKVRLRPWWASNYRCKLSHLVNNI